MGLSRHKLNQIDKLAEKAIQEDAQYFIPAIEGYQKAIESLEEELVDLEDNENLYRIYQNLSYMVREFLNQYEYINFELINSSIKTIQNFFTHKDKSAAKYGAEIKNNLEQSIKILEPYCIKLQQDNTYDSNRELHAYLPIIQLLKNVLRPPVAESTRLLTKRTLSDPNAGLTERQAIKVAKQRSTQHPVIQGRDDDLDILATAALQKAYEDRHLGLGDQSPDTQLANLTPDNALAPNNQYFNDATTVSDSTFTFFSNSKPDQQYRPPQMKPLYYPEPPATFNEWYKRLIERETANMPGRLKTILSKPYVPEPNAHLFEMFRKEYQAHYGVEPPEQEKDVLQASASYKPFR